MLFSVKIIKKIKNKGIGIGIKKIKNKGIALVVWGIRIQPTFALVRVVKGD